DQGREGWIAERAPALELLGQERVGVVAGSQRDRARPGGQGLHQHPAAARPAPGPAGQLRDQGEGPLLGAEVGEAQRLVGVEHYAQGDVWEVVALGDHLRPTSTPAGAAAKRSSVLARAPSAAKSESR